MKMSSPEKKRIKIDEHKSVKDVTENKTQRRLRSQAQAALMAEKEIKILKRINFVTACEEVSRDAYFNRQFRLQLVYVPPCATGECKHSTKHEAISRETPSHSEKSFMIEVNNGMWYDALELCQACITHDQYLSANILKEVVEIIMNVHEDKYVNYTIDDLIDKCQQVLALNFSTHPPCLPRDLRKCYNKFLLSPMDLRKNTSTNRSSCDSNQGIVKYCMNRLMNDINEESKDGPIVDKYDNVPIEMRDVQRLHWEKQKNEIFECLEQRSERIKRIMAVLESVIELLQFDLAIWQRRHTSKLGEYIMQPKDKPLIAFILWSSNPLLTGAVTDNCRQIMRLFIYFIQLQYPEEHIHVMTTWLNTMIETFYICETKSNSDYPNIGKYCYKFASNFYEMLQMQNLDCDSVIRILERIQPPFMQHLVGIHVTRAFLSIEESNITKILIDFIKSSKWNNYAESQQAQIIKRQTLPEDTTDILQFLTNLCVMKGVVVSNSDSNNNSYPKLQRLEYMTSFSDHELNQAVHVLYITFASYLEAYSVQQFQDTLDSLNMKLEQGHDNTDIHLHITGVKKGHYSVSEEFIKTYRSMYQSLKELIQLWIDRKGNDLPEVFKVFKNLSVFEGLN